MWKQWAVSGSPCLWNVEGRVLPSVFAHHCWLGGGFHRLTPANLRSDVEHDNHKASVPFQVVDWDANFLALFTFLFQTSIFSPNFCSYRFKLSFVIFPSLFSSILLFLSFLSFVYSFFFSFLLAFLSVSLTSPVLLKQSCDWPHKPLKSPAPQSYHYLLWNSDIRAAQTQLYLHNLVCWSFGFFIGFMHSSF